MELEYGDKIVIKEALWEFIGTRVPVADYVVNNRVNLSEDAKAAKLIHVQEDIELADNLIKRINDYPC